MRTGQIQDFSYCTTLSLRFLLLAVISLYSVTLSAQPSTSLAIENTNILDISNNRIIEQQFVLIDDSSISYVGSAATVTIPAGTTTIDGTNLFLMPGLSDMHVHLELADLPLYVANGITTVIEMNGSPEKLELRSRVDDKSLIGPRIYMASPLLAGTPQDFAFQLILNPQQARQAVQTSRDLGYDFIKVYDGLSAESYQEIVESANALGMPLLGHIPATTGLQKVLSDNFKSIEHVEQIARATVGHDFDHSHIAEIVAQIESGNSAVTPTLAAMEILSNRRTLWFNDLFNRDEMKFTPAAVKDWWESFRVPANFGDGLEESAPGGSSAAIEFYRALTLALYEANVLLLSGTDTPNPLLVPGFSLHHELAALSRAGISNAGVLAIATSNAARHLGTESELGGIMPGQRADLLLLRENPLLNLEALKSIEGVILDGSWINKAELADLLANQGQN